MASASALTDQLVQQFKDLGMFNPRYFQQVYGSQAMGPGILPWVQQVRSPQEMEQMLRQDLAPRPGESRQGFFKRISQKYPGSWQAFAKLAENGDWEGKGSKEFNDLFAQEGPDPNKQFGSQVTQQMSDFLNFLNQPVDLKSPYAQNILQGTAFNTMRQAQLGGVRGGLSGASTERAVANAAMGLEAQRQDRLMQALGMGSGRDIGLQGQELGRSDLAERRYQFDVGQGYKQYQQAQENQMAQQAALGGLGGAIIGSPGGPAGMAAGYQAGAGIAGGLGGSMYPTWSAPMRP